MLTSSLFSLSLSLFSLCFRLIKTTQGTKFNTKKEDVVGETYLGIQVKRGKNRLSFFAFFVEFFDDEKTTGKKLIFSKKNLETIKTQKQVYRFYLRCSACSAEITFKTDPANTGYAVEAGATRNYEPWRDKSKAEEGDEEGTSKGGEDEGGGGGIGTSANPHPSSGPVPGDAMAALEARAAESRREMATLDALDELRAINALKERNVGVGAALAALRGEAGKEEGKTSLAAAGSSNPSSLSAAALEAEEDEAAVREMLLARAGAVKRIEEEEEEEGGGEEEGDGRDASAVATAGPASTSAAAALAAPPPPVLAAASGKRPAAPPTLVVMKKKKKKVEKEEGGGEAEKKKKEEEEKANGSDDGEGGGGGGLAGLLGGYGSSSPSS